MSPAQPATVEPSDLDQLLAAYPGAGSGHDEMLGGDGRVRGHWLRFMQDFAALGPSGRQVAGESTRRLLRESGIAFNVYADPDDRAHAWRLDLLPVLLHESEWRKLEAGLIQRARLLDATLRDLYGPQRLLTEGVLPPALVYGSDAFVRPEVGPTASDHRHLVFYACDIARSADGSWVVLGDQTDCAIGNGYALASRVALSYGLSDLFLACNTRRLAGHYRGVQESLQALSERDDGRIVVMSPGPENPCYFSHAYLARYLGYTLAEAADLTVRDNLLFLKTLDGLQRVDLVIRMVPGHRLDPLHLPGSGLDGIPGLMAAVRSGRLQLANRAGAGLLQHRALGAFSEALCQRLLGEQLLLSENRTLWLGDPAMRAEALASLPELTLTHTRARNDPGEPCTTIRPAGLAMAGRDMLVAELGHQGYDYVAQRPVALATTPSLDESGRLVPRPFALRAFVAATADGFHVLPGGLVRLAGEARSVALPNGFGSKDLWITADRPETHALSLLKATMREVHLRRTGRDLLSRTADNLFWLGRYVERAESTMRLLRSVLTRLLEDARPEADPLVLRCLLELGLRGEAPLPPDDDTSLEALESIAGILMFEPLPYGLRESLDHVHRTATLARDQISHDAWRMLNALHVDRRWRHPQQRAMTRQALELLDDGIRALSAFSGTESENMTRNFAWRFLGMGRRIERAVNLLDLVRGLVVAGGPGIETDGSLRLLLELGDSFMTYRSRYLMTILLTPVLDLLLVDETNPRSVAYQLSELDLHLAQLEGEAPRRSAAQRLVLEMLTALRLAELTDLATVDPAGNLPALSALLERLIDGLPRLSDMIGRSYFAHAETAVATLAMRRRAAS